jgi:hypothetical protein
VVNSIWEELTDGTECDPHDSVDVSEFVDYFLLAAILTNEDLEQALELRTVETYSNSSESTSVSYKRERLNSEAPWGGWKVKNHEGY